MTTRSWVSVVAAVFAWTALSGPAAAEQKASIGSAMGDLRWGMSERDVTTYVKRMIAERYVDQLKKADAGKQASLRDQLKREQAAVEKSRVEFEGGKSRWDSSPIAGEFHYGNDESMLIAKGEGSESYYLFRDGQLWKWVKVLDGKGDFKKFASSVEDKFGKGRAKKGEVAPGAGDGQWLEYIDRTSRLRAVDNTSRNARALVFEDLAAVREMASLRPAKPSRLAGADDEEEAPAKAAAPAKSSDESIARAQTKRSVFANDKAEESESDYQARKQKETNDARERAQRQHARKQDAKQGEVLKQLDAVNDSDPLGGL